MTDLLPMKTGIHIVIFFGAIFLPVGVGILINVILNLWGGGRLRLARWNAKWRQTALKLVLLFLSVAYIPITNAIIGLINCESVSCPNGQFFRPFFFTAESVDRIYYGVVKQTVSTCLACEGTCPAFADVCTPQSESRLVGRASWRQYLSTLPLN